MATIKARYPTWYPIADGINETIVYSNGIRLGEMISVSVSPEYQQTSPLSGSRRIFTSASVALNTSHLTFEAFKNMFGCEDRYDNELRDMLSVSRRGGLAYITGEQEEGCRFWRVHFLRNVTLIPPSESAVTFNGQVTFTTPSISGTAWPDYETGRWRERKNFKYFDDAEFALLLLEIDGRLLE